MECAFILIFGIRGGYDCEIRASSDLYWGKASCISTACENENYIQYVNTCRSGILPDSAIAAAITKLRLSYILASHNLAGREDPVCRQSGCAQPPVITAVFSTIFSRIECSYKLSGFVVAYNKNCRLKLFVQSTRIRRIRRILRTSRCLPEPWRAGRAVRQSMLRSRRRCPAHVSPYMPTGLRFPRSARVLSMSPHTFEDFSVAFAACQFLQQGVRIEAG